MLRATLSSISSSLSGLGKSFLLSRLVRVIDGRHFRAQGATCHSSHIPETTDGKGEVTIRDYACLDRLSFGDLRISDSQIGFIYNGWKLRLLAQVPHILFTMECQGPNPLVTEGETERAQRLERDRLAAEARRAHEDAIIEEASALEVGALT